MYKGKSYPICCSGCRDAFLDDPEKYVKEFEKSKK
jgi:YHS domain-containing protein